MDRFFYPSKVYSGTILKPYRPEVIIGRIMLNPIYKAKLFGEPQEALVDSGAFQDIDKEVRLSPEQALDRQLKYREKFRMQFGESWDFEAVSIYDQMIGVDEQIINGKKVKKRGTLDSAMYAIEETLKSAHYYKTRENETQRMVYIAQGITTKQYIDECAIPLLTYLRPGIDYFGFGGFCIIGRQRKQLLPLFKETVIELLPILHTAGVHRVHIYGVCIPEAIEFIVNQASQYAIQVSTDSSAPEINGIAFGKQYKDGRPTIHLEKGTYDKIDLAEYNIKEYNRWMQQI